MYVNFVANLNGALAPNCRCINLTNQALPMSTLPTLHSSLEFAQQVKQALSVGPGLCTAIGLSNIVGGGVVTDGGGRGSLQDDLSKWETGLRVSGPDRMTFGVGLGLNAVAESRDGDSYRERTSQVARLLKSTCSGKMPVHMKLQQRGGEGFPVDVLDGFQELAVRRLTLQ